MCLNYKGNLRVWFKLCYSMQNNQVVRFVDKMGISSSELELRKDYFGLNDKDVRALKKLHDDISSSEEDFISDFYLRLKKYPEVSEILTQEVIEKLIGAQSIYFQELTSGQYDLSYVTNRLRLGLIHHNRGIKPKLFLGAYANYLNGILDLAFDDVNEKEREFLDTIIALFRIVLFDISLGLESYFLADNQSIIRLKDFSETIISSIPIAMVIVDEQFVIKKANQIFVELFDIEGFSEGSGLNEYVDSNEIKDAIGKVQAKHNRNNSIRINIDIASEKHYLKVDVSPLILDDEIVTIVTFNDVTETENLTNELQASQIHLKQILNSVFDTIITIDKTGKVISSNESVEEIFEYSESEIEGNDISELIPSIYDVEEVKEFINQNESNFEVIKTKKEILIKGRTKSGDVFPIEISLTEISTETGMRLIVVVKDVSEIIDSKVKANELSSVIEQTADSVMVTDENAVISYVNPAFEKMSGYSYDDVVGNKPALLKSGRHGIDFYERLWETINRGDVFNDIFINRKSNGDTYYEEKTITPLKDEKGKIDRFVSTGKDVTERIHAEEHLFHMANHDALTNLPNRSLLSERIKQSISRARWHDRLVALLFIDLDQFKMINDTLGHDIGDELLVEVSKRLKGCIRDGDTVSRLGGDEFAILLTDLASTDDVDPIAEKILTQVSAPYNIQSRQLFISASIGISCFPEDGNEAKILLRNADVAMYRAKDNGRNKFEYFSHEMTTRAFKRLNLETHLRNALDKDEFVLNYQPQYSQETGKMTGAEALIRWNSAELGLVQPDEFVPILEDTGLIVPVGQWIIKTSCELMHDLEKFGVHLPVISINLSARQVSDDEIISVLKKAMSDANIAADRVTIEITESLLMENKQQSTSMLRQFRDMGLNIAIDDFGTGYSSLSYLTRFPINIVKIDRSFMTDVPENEQNCSLTSAIISMTHDLGLKVVAEGVENIEQVEFLRDRNCDVFQGFYFSKPVDERELKILLGREQGMLSN